MRFWDDQERWLAYVRDAINEPAIGRDLLALESVRKPAMLRQVVALACSHPAEIWSLDKISAASARADVCIAPTVGVYSARGEAVQWRCVSSRVSNVSVRPTLIRPR